jgi:hypothetical protein
MRQMRIKGQVLIRLATTLIEAGLTSQVVYFMEPSLIFQAQAVDQRVDGLEMEHLERHMRSFLVEVMTLSSSRPLPLTLVPMESLLKHGFIQLQSTLINESLTSVTERWLIISSLAGI